MNESIDPIEQSNSDSKSDRKEVSTFEELRIRRASPRPDGRNAYEQLKDHVVQHLSLIIEQDFEGVEQSDLRPLLLERFDNLVTEENIVLTRTERRLLIEDVFAEIFGS